MNLPAWITIKRFAGDTSKGYWQITDANYLDPGNTIVYAYAEKEDGSPAMNGQAIQKNGGVTPLHAELKDGKAESTFQMTGDSSFDPQRGEVGPYSLYMFGQSDVISGMGLPLKQHVELHVTFRWATGPTPPPGDFVTHQEFEAYKQKMRDANV